MNPTLASSCRARVEDRLMRIETENDANSIFISVAADHARAEADAADARHAAGQQKGTLDGVIVGVKDNLAVAGLPRTGGTGLKPAPESSDAACVAKLRAAGAVILGTLNMHEGALGATTDNPFHGRCSNPLGEGLTPGGSSGGSGAAVAAQLVDLALGTDTMGSVRIPAAYCGTFGLKPTDGLIGRDGLMLLCEQLDTIGVLTADPGLLLPALETLAGQGNDPFAVIPPSDWPQRSAGALKVLVPEEIAQVDCDAAQMDALQRVETALTKCGVIIEHAPLSGWHPGQDRRGGLLLVEAEGARLLADILADPAQRECLSADFRGLLDYGAHSSALKLSGALSRLRSTRAAVERAFANYDLILTPTAPQQAFRFETGAPANQADFTSLANFAGVPALSLPVALPGEPLPGAAQLLARPWAEKQLCSLAQLLAPLAHPEPAERT
ncbi:amidase [uncultured Cohaesibacter sp.]|uniref:amidase n=1 Tax=uncultured Cohaesibacter sp. TaxID=1002546 RepID=UPI0029C886D2|nr:amidase [uncultured Cohaesibacter sp.]